MAGRVTQQPVRVAIVPNDALGRVTQQPVRVAIVPNDALGRVTQQSVRVAVRGDSLTAYPAYAHKIHVVWVD